MAQRLTLTQYRNDAGTVTVFTPASHIQCECGSRGGYMETVSANLARTLARMEWTCSGCGADNSETLTSHAYVGQAFEAMGH